MRRFAALLLAICLLISLSACGTEEPPITPTATAEAEDLSAKIPMDEWERAAWYGFLPEDAGDPDSAVTWALVKNSNSKHIVFSDMSGHNKSVYCSSVAILVRVRFAGRFLVRNGSIYCMRLQTVKMLEFESNLR